MKKTLLVFAILLLVSAVAPAAGATVATTTAVTGHQSRETSLITADGRALFVVLDNASRELVVVRCDDVACTQRSAPTTVPGLGQGDTFPEVALAPNGNPVIAVTQGPVTGSGVMVGPTSKELRLVRCTSPTCSTADPFVTLDASGDVRDVLGVQVDAAGNPVVLFNELRNDVFMVRCNDPACAGGDDPRVTLPVGGAATLDLNASGNPVVVSGDGILVCNDPLCAGGDDLPVGLDDADYSAIQVRMNAADAPVVAAVRSVQNQRSVAVVVCADPACSSTTVTPLPNVPATLGELSLRSDDRPVMVVSDRGQSGELFRVVVCNSPTCTGQEFASDLLPFTQSDASQDLAIVNDTLLVFTSSFVADGARQSAVTTCDDSFCVQGEPVETTALSAPQEAAVQAAIDVSMERFPERLRDSSARPVIATVGAFADALAGTPLTGEAPLLLTGGDLIHPDVLAELDRLDIQRLYLLGGTAALSQQVEDQLTGAGYFVDRLAGPTRIQTSLAVADEVRAEGDGEFGVGTLARAFGVEGNPTAAWADAITVGGYLASTEMRIALAPTTPGDQGIEMYIGGSFEELVLLGGTAALSEGYDNEVSRRVQGSNRFETARQIALELWSQPESGPRTYLLLDVTAELGWAYGLPAAGLSADLGAPTLAVGSTVPPATLEAVSGCDGQVALRTIGPVAGDVLAQLEAADDTPC